MPRLMDMGLDQLNSLLLDMANLSQQAVAASIDAYSRGAKGNEVRQMSNRLRSLHRQVSDLAMEMIARYQPVASDLRFLKACMEISYGFFRYGRYALDIASVLDMFGDLGKCDKKFVVDTAKKTQEMIRMSVEAFARRDVEMARNIPKMDDVVDESYRSNLRQTVERKGGDIKCALSATLILRYLERIADHASYIGESVEYIATGIEPKPD
ncbi:MAG TPA: PhoU domain-containing protein [Nitrososphaerales archaeon]|nr:PhoU domain-containing protein [Nitrososphaerales archaeon]